MDDPKKKTNKERVGKGNREKNGEEKKDENESPN